MHIKQRSGRIGTAPFLDGVVVHDAGTGRLFQLNHTAGLVWRSLEAGKPKEVIVDDLTRVLEADPATVRRDLDAFVDALQVAGLFGLPELPDRDSGTEARPPRGAPALDAAYMAGDVPVRVICYPADVAAAFAPLAAPALAPDSAVVEARLELFHERGAFVLTRDDRIVGRLDTGPAARWALVQQLVAATRRGRSLALLHAGAVLTPAGCLLICGESGAGKSTLLASLVHAGLGFVADDILPLEEGSGLVWPVRLAISIKHDSWPLICPLFPELAGAPIVRFGGRTMRYLWPDSHAVARSTTGSRVTAVVFPRYAEGMPAVLSPLDPVRSLTLLGEGGSILPFADGGLAEFLAWWSAIPAYQLSYGRLDEAIAKVFTLTDRLRQDSEGGADAPLAPSAMSAAA